MNSLRRRKAALAAMAVFLLAHPINAWESQASDWTALTLSRSGAWGVATDRLQAKAIVGAMRACRAMSPAAGDCGALFKIRRGAWIIGRLCGRENILAAGATRRQAEQMAMLREIELRLHYFPGLPPCIKVVTANPRGEVDGRNLASSRN
jgi:hypothetical protein